jgi:hypothetical protein
MPLLRCNLRDHPIFLEMVRKKLKSELGKLILTFSVDAIVCMFMYYILFTFAKIGILF